MTTAGPTVDIQFTPGGISCFTTPHETWNVEKNSHVEVSTTKYPIKWKDAYIRYGFTDDSAARANRKADELLSCEQVRAILEGLIVQSRIRIRDAKVFNNRNRVVQELGFIPTAGEEVLSKTDDYDDPADTALDRIVEFFPREV